jgi:hypothetical protein
MKKFVCIYLFTLLFSGNFLLAQETKKDVNKIQEVISLTSDPVSSPPNADGSIVVDTTPPKGMAASEILKRAVNFVKSESSKYIKGNGVTTGEKAECIVTFAYKPKELNPVADVQGTITMHLSIEAKEGKYRYTVSKINHNAKISDNSGGDVFNEVPKCGSMFLPSDLWKRIKSEALKQSATLISDVKEAMKVSSSKSTNADEW